MRGGRTSDHRSDLARNPEHVRPSVGPGLRTTTEQESAVHVAVLRAAADEGRGRMGILRAIQELTSQGVAAMRTSLATLFVMAAGLLVLTSGQAVAAAKQSSAKTVTIAMHDAGCHWFSVGGKFVKTLAAKGPITLANYDEAAIKVADRKVSSSIRWARRSPFSAASTRLRWSARLPTTTRSSSQSPDATAYGRTRVPVRRLRKVEAGEPPASTCRADRCASTGDPPRSECQLSSVVVDLLARGRERVPAGTEVVQAFTVRLAAPAVPGEEIQRVSGVRHLAGPIRALDRAER